MFQLARSPRRAQPQGEAVVHPRGIERRYGISAVTRWRWERDGKLPPRDVFLADGTAIGWRPATLDAADRGPAAA